MRAAAPVESFKEAPLGPAGLDALRHVEEPPTLALVVPPPLRIQAPPAFAAAVGPHLTARQHETSLRACQALADAGVFFLGDGPGTGKTRILAAVALHYALVWPGVRRLWLVPNALLRRQALQELALLGATAEVQSYAQLRQRGAPDPADVLVLLDEAHALKHATAQTRAVEELQHMARAVVYSTATPASDVRHLGYMTRLGLWGPGGPFPDFRSFAASLARWGLGAAELLALDLKRRGLYCCHRLPEVCVQQLELAASAPARELFDASIRLWAAPAPAGGERLLFFKRLLASLKARLLAPRWTQDLRDGYALVVVLQGTGAAAQQNADGTMMQRCLRRAGRAADFRLPLDALTEVRAALPDVAVGEISGRAAGLRAGAGSNARALAAFQRGELRVLVLSAAGAVGLNVTSPHPIRMYIVELPAVPETLAQQLGRCNRLNTTHAPEYFHASLRTLVERRTEARLAKRSSTLGALVCADQHRKLLQSPAWSTLQLCWVTLELVTRALSRRAPDWCPPAGLPEVSARQELQAVTGLDRAQLLTGAPEQALALVLQRCPAAAEWVAPPCWTPALHGLFPAAVRRAAATAALCLFRSSHLTSPLVAHVLGFALGDAWDVRPALAALGPELLDAAAPAAFMDAAAEAPLATQQALLRCCEAAARRCPAPPGALRSLEAYCRQHVEHADRYDVQVQVRAGSPAADCHVCVHFLARDRPVAAPALHLLPSGRLVSLVPVEDGVELRLPGKARGVAGRTFPDAARALQACGVREAVPVDALARFRTRETAELERLRRRGEAATRLLRLALAEPLRRWETSLRQVLTFEVGGQAVAGLLLHDGAFSPADGWDEAA